MPDRRFFARGMLAVSMVLIGLIAGYVYGVLLDILTVDAVAGSWSTAVTFALPLRHK